MEPNASLRPPTPDRQAAKRSGKRARPYKRTVLAFLLGSALFALLAVLSALVIDPLQFYHKPWFHRPVYLKEQRYQNPGLARNYDYETIIIGTSMTENFFPGQVEEAIGGKTIKLSMRGSLADEQHKIARLALETGKPKTVLWGLDYFALRADGLDDQDVNADYEFPHYLYDRDLLNDYKYWFNYYPYREFAKELVRELLTGRSTDLDGLYNWNHMFDFGEDVAVRHYRKAMAEAAALARTGREGPIEEAQASFRTNILSLVEAYPDVKFLIYYPPYSILRHVYWRETNPERYAHQLVMKEWMYAEFSRHPNVEVYDFQTEADWTFDLDNYKDMSHHHQDINAWIAQAIGRRDPDYLVTADNVRRFAEELRRQTDEAALSDDGRLFRVRVYRDGGGAPERLALGLMTIGKNGSLRVPAKELAELLGARLEWNPGAKRLRLTGGGRSFELTVGEKTAAADGEPMPLADAASIEAGRTLVPLAETAAAFGWEASRSDIGDREFEVLLKAPQSR
jgi:hypothetical protein